MTRLCRKISPGGSYAVFIMENPSDGGSVLTKDAMDALWELDAKVLAVEVSARRFSIAVHKDPYEG